MVVLSAAVCTKGGRALIARQYVDISRVRIEGLLAAFPKLMGADKKQHTFIETESVRYLYQPIDKLYVVVITNRISNIVEDLDTLHLIAKLTTDYCRVLDERSIRESAFDLIFAFDEVVQMGYKEKVTIAQIRTFTEMDSHEEKIYEMLEKNKEREAREEMKRRQHQIERAKEEIATNTGPAYSGQGGSGGGRTYTPAPSSDFTPTPQPKRETAPAPSQSRKKGMVLKKAAKKANFLKQMEEEGELEEEPQRGSGPVATSASGSGPAAVAHEAVHLALEEHVTVVAHHDGGLETMEVNGVMTVTVIDPEAPQFVVLLDTDSGGKTVRFNTHPNISKPRFNKKKELALKNPNKPLPINTPLGVLKWRFPSSDEDDIPLTVTCWPTADAAHMTVVNMEYELNNTELELHEVVIEIPTPGGSTPVVEQHDGQYNYDTRGQILRWVLPIIDEDNGTGSLEFKVPWVGDASEFFPLKVSFTSPSSFCGVSVIDVIAASEDCAAPKYSSEHSLVTDNYEIL